MITARWFGLVLSLLPVAAGCSGDDEPEVADPQGMDDSQTMERDPLAAPDDVAAPPADAETTDSGLASKVLVAGTGTRFPAATDRVRVHYTGWQTTGRRFDSSRDGAAQPIEFSLGGVIDGWTEGLQLMVEGEQRRFWIPQELAYNGNTDPRYPMGMLVFDVELIAILTP